MIPNQSPIETLHRAMASAVYTDLPDAQQYRRDSLANLTEAEQAACLLKQPELGIAAWPGKWERRRPRFDEVVVRAMFVQSWGSTTMGFGGVGGAAATAAYTLVLAGPDGAQAVYFNGSFAYLVAAQSEKSAKAARLLQSFREDVAAEMVANVMEAVVRYGARPR